MIPGAASELAVQLDRETTQHREEACKLKHSRAFNVPHLPL